MNLTGWLGAALNLRRSSRVQQNSIDDIFISANAIDSLIILSVREVKFSASNKVSLTVSSCYGQENDVMAI